MSTYFRVNGSSLSNESITVEDSVNDSTDIDNFNSILYVDEYKPNINNDELWRSELSFSIVDLL